MLKLVKNCFLIAQVGIAGSTKCGNNVIFAGQTGCTGHITIGDNAKFAGKLVLLVMYQQMLLWLVTQCVLIRNG